MRSNSIHRYSVASIVLHWLMLLLIIAAYAAIEFREIFPKGSGPREALKTWHFMLGLSVLGLVWLRIAARLSWASPHSPEAEPPWRRVVARAVHLTLYLFMIAMPMAGWLILSAEGETVSFFGLELPPLVGTNEILSEQTEQLHEFGGVVGYWLIGIHAAASLIHQYIFKDHVLARMIPLHS